MNKVYVSSKNIYRHLNYFYYGEQPYQHIIHLFLGESRNGLYGNATGKKDLYERGHVATCSRGQAVALTVFIFSSIFFTSLAIAFVRPFSLDEAISKVSPSYIDHCEEVPGLHSGKNTTFLRFSHLIYTKLT